MKITLSQDYKGPGFGMLTQARGYDKLTHFAVSAIAVFAIALALSSVTLLIFRPLVMLGAGLFVLGAGIGIEIYQGRRRWDYDHADVVFPTSYDPTDGFSFLDLLADVLGVAFALWTLWRW